MTTNRDMVGYRILNVAYPRDPRKYESDLVTSKILYDYMFQVYQNYTRRDRDGLLDGRLDMSNHKISGLILPMLMMPLQGDMWHRGFKHSVMKFKIKRVSWMPIKNFIWS